MSICFQVIPWSWALVFFSWIVCESPSSGGCGGQQSKIRSIRSLIVAYFGLPHIFISIRLFQPPLFGLYFPCWPLTPLWPPTPFQFLLFLSVSHPFSASTFPPVLSASGFLSGSPSFQPAQNIETPWRLWICKFPFQTSMFHLDMSSHTFSTPQLTRNNPCPSWHLAVRTIWVYAQGILVALSVIPTLPGLSQHCTVVLMEV